MTISIEQKLANGRAWRKRNAVRINRERRERYHSSPEYRSAVQRRKDRYSAQKESGYVPEYPEMHRTFLGKSVRVRCTEEVARILKIRPARINQWVRRNHIPNPLFEDRKRYYTSSQMCLMRELAELNPYDREGWLRVRKKIYKFWLKP